MHYFLISAILGYLLGSINPSVLLGKLFFSRDLRAYGSNNPGTCNTVYVYGVKTGAVVLLVDALKGIGSVWIVRLLFASKVDDLQFLLLFTAFFAVFGHCHSLFLRFKGGKGFATFTGVTIYLFPQTILILLVAFLLAVLISKYISIGTFTVVTLSPLLQVYNYHVNGNISIKSLIILFIISIFIIYRHRENIAKLRNGTEISIRTPRIKQD